MSLQTWLFMAPVILAACGSRTPMDFSGSREPDVDSAGGAGRSGASGGGSITSGTGGNGGFHPTGGSGGIGGGASSACAGASAGSPDVSDASVDTPCGITYPLSGFFGENILYPDTKRFAVDPASYDMAAFVPLGVALRVRITNLSGGLGPFFEVASNDWRMKGTPDVGQDYDPKETGRQIGVKMKFLGAGTGCLEYFECGSTTPTRSKVYRWGP